MQKTTLFANLFEKSRERIDKHSDIPYSYFIAFASEKRSLLTEGRAAIKAAWFVCHGTAPSFAGGNLKKPGRVMCE